MRRLLRLLELVAFVSCVIVVLATLALIPLERSGTLRDMLQARVDATLGEGLSIGSVRVHWSDPGVRLMDVVILAQGSHDAPRELARIDEIRTQFSFFPPRLALVSATRGSVTLGPELAEWAA